MGKDPAFLFYPNDYIGGTMGMTFEEKGAYIELLMLQFNRGHMGGHMIGQTVGQIWDKIKDKFQIDSEGLYYNARLDEEIAKRKEYSNSRRNNLLGKNQHTKKTKNDSAHMGGHMTSHMENENENENEDKNEYEKTIDSFKEFRKKIRKPMTEKAEKLLRSKLKELSGGKHEIAIKILEQSIMNGWQGVFELTRNTGTPLARVPQTVKFKDPIEFEKNFQL